MAAEQLAQLVGRNARRIRSTARLTLDRVAQEVTDLGKPWSHSQVAAFERGSVAPSLPTILVVAAALHRLAGPVTLADLAASDDPVQLTEGLAVDAATLAAVLGGGAVELTAPSPFASVDDTEPRRSVLFTTGRTERELATALEVSAATVVDASGELWGRSFTAERDARAGDGATAQAKGRVSRILRDELRAKLDEYAAHEDH